ncbi:MAG: hypothetical protein RJA36_304 [Pseudomonadota bacterium]|jgi:hypothetical protein
MPLAQYTLVLEGPTPPPPIVGDLSLGLDDAVVAGAGLLDPLPQTGALGAVLADAVVSATGALTPLAGAELSNFVVNPHADGKRAGWTITWPPATPGFFSLVVVPTGTATPAPETLEDWAVNGTGPTLHRTSLEMTTLTDGTPPINGLTQEVSYIAMSTVKRSATPGDYAPVVTYAFTTPDAVPILSGLVATFKGQTTGIASWLTDDQTGASKVAVYPAASSPSDDDVVAGTGATFFVSKTVTATGRVSVPNITGLTGGIAYRVHIIQVDANGNRSNKITYDFTTPATETVRWRGAHDGALSGGLVVSSNITVGTAQVDPLGNSNGLTLEANPGGVSTICRIYRSLDILSAAPRFRFFVKKLQWASPNAWIRFVSQNLTINPNMSFNLDTGAFSSVSPRITNNIAIPLEDGFWYLQFDADLYDDGTDDLNGLFGVYLADATGSSVINVAGLHKIAFHDYQGVY